MTKISIHDIVNIDRQLLKMAEISLMNKEGLKLLTNLGLSQKAIEVYITNLELGSATIQELAAHSGIKRTSVYHLLEELKNNQLITEVKKGYGTLIVPENPNVLVEISKKKTREAQSYTKKVEDVIPELLSIFNVPATKPRIRFYEGIEGIKKVYEDTLNTKGNIYAFSDYEKMLTTMDPDYMIDYANRRAAKDIKFFSIGTSGSWTGKIVELSKKQKREMKVSKQLKFETEINIYGNKVALISFVRPYMALIIENRSIAQTLGSIWKVVWNSLE